MKNVLCTISTILVITTNTFSQRQELIEKFELGSNDMKLTRLAQPTQYFDKIGRKAALMGFESGTFELWVWPWKVLRSFELQFFTGTSTQPIHAHDIVRNISVTPEATILSFVYESFTVKEIILVPRFEQGVIILLDVHTTVPLTIVPGFVPVLQPQWPAGIGGQYSYWYEEAGTYVISESQERALFLCGSPSGEKMAQPPAHMFADNPLQFQISVKPGETDSDNKYIPIVIAGGSEIKIDSAKTLFNKLCYGADKYYRENSEYYRDLRNSTLQVITPDKELNLAFEWGKVALHNLLVTNPTLGTGLVAGYGLSGGGGRPGFAWHFGGDAFINSLALSSYGDYTTVREALSFTQKWQRQDNFPIRKKSSNDVNIDIGKMAHELTQSEGLIDWWNDYHYGYNHADTSPWYLVAIGDYFKKKGDIEFIKQSWKSIVQAYRWCVSKDSNDDGLMDLKGAGLGALEFGKLVKIHNDIYTQGLWAQGLKEVITMATHVGDKDIQLEAQKLFEQAKESLERIYWMEDLGYYSFGANENGVQVRDKTIWPSSIMMFDLLDKERSKRTIKALNQPDMVTDWGVRNLSNSSSLYEPSNYNYGTVWPFASAFLGVSQYNYLFSLQGWSTLRSTYHHVFDYGLGVVPEVFSGTMNTKLGEAYHNQGFSVTGYMLPLIRGLCGLEVDALNNKIIFSPHLPANWNNLVIKNIHINSDTLNLELSREDNSLSLSIEKSGSSEFEIEFRPELALGTKIRSAIVNGSSIDYQLLKNKQAYQLETLFATQENCVATFEIESPVELFLLPFSAPSGAINHSMKIISQELDDNTLYVVIEGISGETYKLGIRNTDKILSIEGASLSDNILEFSFENRGENKFARKEIEIETAGN